MIDPNYCQLSEVSLKQLDVINYYQNVNKKTQFVPKYLRKSKYSTEFYLWTYFNMNIVVSSKVQVTLWLTHYSKPTYYSEIIFKRNTMNALSIHTNNTIEKLCLNFVVLQLNFRFRLVSRVSNSPIYL